MPGFTGGALSLRLARALLPAWRFFDEIEPAPRLSVRMGAAAEALGAWETAKPAGPSNGIISLLFRPAGNLALASHALLEQLLDDVAAPDMSAERVEQLVSYKLVTRLARAQLPAHASGCYQFRLTLEHTASVEELLVSSVIAL
jgi:hypothetical protein